ncbi:hypothetical protein A3SI_01686 [Nitritalea halalkaliphila LW7]|uniref:DUF3810 domain-containing protein n=1 Tax=Nitritalea halalkaliphila LW7 TaxID=1189621 RepID=I5CA89_9BACT|nr:DUF3810 domain-containing protein [Nitritalea halalkaliphila]EIM78741.1 hypothetical protein A3SI_01686 [Nitritalea halalkaliphila LW7]
MEFKKFFKSYLGLLLGLIALAVRFLFDAFPQLAEYGYARGLFPFLRLGLDFSVGLLPFPLIYLFFIAVLAVFFRFFWRLRQRTRWTQRLAFASRALLNGVGFLLFSFLVVWGFNYQRFPVVQQAGLQKSALSLEQLQAEMQYTVQDLDSLRALLTTDTLALEASVPFRELERDIRAAVKEHVGLLGLNNPGRPRTHPLYPKGLMRRLGIIGIYFPFTGESYIDASLHFLEQPFTIAHEMAHSFGVTSEGEANLVAWVVGYASSDPLLRYSAQVQLLLYQLRDFYFLAPDQYGAFVGALPKGVLADLRALQENRERYRPLALEFSKKVNDTFLKAQGVKAGVESYHELPMLAAAWRQRGM